MFAKPSLTKLQTSDAPRRTLALLLALTTALGPTAMPAFAASKPAVKQPGKTRSPQLPFSTWL